MADFALIDGPMHGKKVGVPAGDYDQIYIPYRMTIGGKVLTVDLVYKPRNDYYCVAEFAGVFVDRFELHGKHVLESYRLKWESENPSEVEKKWEENELKKLSKKSS